jgi:hypothetical protein
MRQSTDDSILLEEMNIMLKIWKNLEYIFV